MEIKKKNFNKSVFVTGLNWKSIFEIKSSEY